MQKMLVLNELKLYEYKSQYIDIYQYMVYMYIYISRHQVLFRVHTYIIYILFRLGIRPSISTHFLQICIPSNLNALLIKIYFDF